MTDKRPIRRAAPVTGGQPPEESGEYRVTLPSEQRSPPPSRMLAGPRRFKTVEMPSVEPPPLRGRLLDDDLGFDIDLDADGALELYCLPSTHSPRVEQPRQQSHETSSAPRSVPRVRTTAPRGILRPPPPAPGAPRRTSSSQTAVDTHAALLAFAGFGDSPTGVFGTPAYAVRVTLRRRALGADLARARQRKSHDVGLYEASLRTADDAAVRTGFIVAAMLLVLGVLLAATLVHVLIGPLPFLR